MTEVEPRTRIVAGIALLLAAGFLVRTVVGPPPGVGAQINRALAWAERGDARRAEQGMQRVLERVPTNADEWYRIGRTMLSLDRAVEAAHYLTKAEELAPDSFTVRYQLARAWAQLGEVARAEDVVASVLAQKPDHGGALYLRSSLAASRGDVLAAMRDLGAAHAAGYPDLERYRTDTRFDGIRNDVRFVEFVYLRLLPGTFREEPS